jgi:hypothetical protein
MTAIDSELRELFRDRPELLRIATAIADTRSVPRQRQRFLPLAVAAALVAIGVTIAVLVSLSGRGPGLVDRALAAIGTEPVIHAVVDYSSPDDVVVNLATGKSYERVHRTEYWYDRGRSLLHTRLTTDGKMLTEIVETPNGSDSDLGHYPGGIAAQLDPALAGFVTHYREALASGEAKIVGHEQVDGREVTLLRITLDHGDSEDVGVDSTTYRPLFFRANPQPSVGIVGNIPTWNVATIESLPRDPSYFAKPALSPPRPTGGGSGSTEELTPNEAAKALEQPALWVGARFGSLPLARIELEQVQTDYTDGSKHNGNKLELAYGDLRPNGRLRASQPWLIIDQAATVAASYQLGFNDGGDPPAPAGSMVLEDNSIFARPGHPAIPERAQWTGKLIRGEMYIELSASSRNLLLAAARALKPLPTSGP